MIFCLSISSYIIYHDNYISGVTIKIVFAFPIAGVRVRRNVLAVQGFAQDLSKILHGDEAWVVLWKKPDVEDMECRTTKRKTYRNM